MKRCNKVPSKTGNPSLSDICIYHLWLVSPWLQPHLPYMLLHCHDISSLSSDSTLGCPERGTACDITVQGVDSKELSIFLPCHHWQRLVLTEKVIGSVGCSLMQHHVASKALKYFYKPLLPVDNVAKHHGPSTPHIRRHFFHTAHESAGELTRYRCKAAPGIQFLFHTGPVQKKKDASW